MAHAETAYDRVVKSGTLRCGYMLWPLWTEKDPNTGAMSGLVVDITSALTERLGLKLEWVEEVPFGQQVAALERGNIDAICTADAAFISGQARYVNYTRPFAYGALYVIVRSDDNRFKELSDLNDSRVIFSALDGNLSMSLAQEKFPQGKLLSLAQSADPSLVMLNVIDGKADAVINDPSTLKAMEKSHPGKLKLLDDAPIATFGLSFTTAKGNYDLTQMLDQGFNILQTLGITNRVIDKYDPTHTDILRVAPEWSK
jgi:ABC-type amino acid transport substrate-binding protein